MAWGQGLRVEGLGVGRIDAALHNLKQTMQLLHAWLLRYGSLEK